MHSLHFIFWNSSCLATLWVIPPLGTAEVIVRLPEAECARMEPEKEEKKSRRRFAKITSARRGFMEVSLGGRCSGFDESCKLEDGYNILHCGVHLLILVQRLLEVRV